jgi:uncharacterized protein YjbJ (UPF0337 family)
MSTTDKTKNTIESAKGTAKKKVGQATGNKSLENRGRAEKAQGDLKQGAEKMKDAVRP